jgi:hypothetical protein
LWIVYAKKVNDSTINISMCSPSLPMRKAEGLVPPPPLFYDIDNKTIDALKVKIHILEKRTEGLSYWFSDLEKLRLNKKQPVVNRGKIDFKEILISLFILTNIVSIFIFIKTRKK